MVVEGDNQQSINFGGNYGYSAMNGGFPNMMGGTGDFNQMQMMMAMNNGMTPNSFGSNFSMMGSFPLQAPPSKASY
jgi:hypothetical protein